MIFAIQPGVCGSPIAVAEQIKVEKVAADVPATTPAGSFPLPVAALLQYRLGWSGLTVARVSIRIQETDGLFEILGMGGTIGIARGIYRVDFSYRSRLRPPGLDLVEHRLTERYRGVRVENEARPLSGGICLSRKGFPESAGNPEKARLYPISDATDLTGALFRIRSLPLRDGDEAFARVCHGDRIYLATVKVAGREPHSFSGRKIPAIKLVLSLQKVGKKGNLEPHKRFRSATSWLSDDSRRDLLRVEGEIFIGRLFAELEPVRQAGEEAGEPGSGG